MSHKSYEDDPDDLDDCAETFTCEICKAKYKHYRTLKHHVKKVHPNEQSELAPAPMDIKIYKYKCEECARQFNDLYNFRAHQRKVHGNNDLEPKEGTLRKCVMCDIKTIKKDMLIHFEEVHEIKLDVKKLEFRTYGDFIQWKEEFEKETESKFVKERGDKVTEHSTRQFFVCHRSGHYKSEGKGERHLKTQGSNKIGGFCPAKIDVTLCNSVCCIEIITSHIGHSNDVGHLFLTTSERSSIAAKIAAKVPFQMILDEVRDSISESGLERIHLLTKKDLFNIENSFNLHSSAVRHKEDGISVEAWVNEVNENGKPCVLFYKPQGMVYEYQPHLKHDDFMLIIMNDAQYELLKKYGSDCICIDSTHGMNAYDFELTTLLVIDDMRQGFPYAFMISNRSDTVAVSLFFSFIKEKTGVISSKVFMSDMAEAFFNAWCNVMGLPQFKLYCSWHVDRAWRKNILKVGIKDKQAEVYKILRTLMQETDKYTFEIMLKKIIKMFSDDKDLNDFGLYFVDNYVKCVSSWAYCYRLHCGLNTNMHLERMHRTIKHIYLKGTHCKRLDKSIDAIMKFVRDKLIDRLVVLHKGKLTSKLKELRNRHKTSLNLSIDSVIENENGWIVSSACSKVFDTYNVQKLNEECSCQLICVDCKACIHQYQCTCLDSSIKWNMCKHIHLVCRYYLMNQKSVNSNVAASPYHNEEGGLPLHINCENEVKVNETTAIISELGRSNAPSTGLLSLAERKENIKRKFIDTIDKLLIPEQVEVLEKMHTTLGPTLEAVYSTAKNSNLTKVCTSIPHNKKIQPQRRLFSVKKTKRNPKNVIAKPTEEEAHKIALSLFINDENINK